MKKGHDAKIDKSCDESNKKPWHTSQHAFVDRFISRNIFSSTGKFQSEEVVSFTSKHAILFAGVNPLHATENNDYNAANLNSRRMPWGKKSLYSSETGRVRL